MNRHTIKGAINIRKLTHRAGRTPSSPHGVWNPIEWFGSHTPRGEDHILPAWCVTPPWRRPPPHTARGGHTLQGGCASVHGVQRPISLEYQICPPATTIWYSSNWNGVGGNSFLGQTPLFRENMFFSGNSTNFKGLNDWRTLDISRPCIFPGPGKFQGVVAPESPGNFQAAGNKQGGSPGNFQVVKN